MSNSRGLTVVKKIPQSEFIEKRGRNTLAMLDPDRRRHLPVIVEGFVFSGVNIFFEVSAGILSTQYRNRIKELLLQAGCGSNHYLAEIGPEPQEYRLVLEDPIQGNMELFMKAYRIFYMEPMPELRVNDKRHHIPFV